MLKIDQRMKQYVDHRDGGPLVLTHIYLLIGCTIPLALYRSEAIDFVDASLTPLSGVIILGIGDTMASLVGVKFGKRRWFQGTYKTIEGTLGATLSVSILCFAFWLLDAKANVNALLGALISMTCSCLLEAFTQQIDNLVLPLFHFALTALLQHQI
jgi:dolichol kinase